MVISPSAAIAVASNIGSHIKANNIASSERFLSVRGPVAIDDLQRLIFVCKICSPAVRGHLHATSRVCYGSSPAGLARPAGEWAPIVKPRDRQALPWAQNSIANVSLGSVLTLSRRRDGQLPRFFHPR